MKRSDGTTSQRDMETSALEVWIQAINNALD